MNEIFPELINSIMISLRSPAFLCPPQLVTRLYVSTPSSIPG